MVVVRAGGKLWQGLWRTVAESEDMRAYRAPPQAHHFLIINPTRDCLPIGTSRVYTGHESVLHKY